MIGLTAYGRCIGLTRQRAAWADDELPRITLASRIFQNANQVSDVLVHEMVHVELALAGVDSGHNGQPWCDEIARLSPRVLGRRVHAEPVVPRWIDGKARRVARDDNPAVRDVRLHYRDVFITDCISSDSTLAQASSLCHRHCP